MATKYSHAPLIPLLLILLFFSLPSFSEASNPNEIETTYPSKTSDSSTKKNFKKNQDFYGAAAHEVPSGPNPESN